jgi:hypothetical protein
VFPVPKTPNSPKTHKVLGRRLGRPKVFGIFKIFGTGKGQKLRFHLLSISLRYPTPLVRLAAIASGCAALSCPVVPARGVAPAAIRCLRIYGLMQLRWSRHVAWVDANHQRAHGSVKLYRARCSVKGQRRGTHAFVVINSTCA